MKTYTVNKEQLRALADKRNKSILEDNTKLKSELEELKKANELAALEVELNGKIESRESEDPMQELFDDVFNKKENK